ncbi:MAG: Rossmann-like domain-containing protein [Promethearchaeota archaeon]|jgi:uncharacterized protein (DUF4213/DUF364 family)
MIIEKTVDRINQIYSDKEVAIPKVSRVVIGLGYTGVEISIHDYKSVLGVASTLTNIINSTDCSKIDFAGNLTNQSVLELLKWSFEPPSIKKIVGIAAVNAASQHLFKMLGSYPKVKGDILDYLTIQKSTNVTVIGLMKPLIRKTREKTKNITLVEDTIKISAEFTGLHFRNKIEELKPEELYTDVLFCTGTALINGSIENILKMFVKKAGKIVIIGPSVSMLPDILFEHGVEVVGGMDFFDPESALRVIQEGGGTKLFKTYGKKYNLIKAHNNND